MLVALTVAVGTALASAHFFGVSLALGAFVAGVVVGESPFSHQVGADLLPFREAFAVLFFVSVGMLVNPEYVVAHWDEVLITIVLIVVVKGLISGLLAVAARAVPAAPRSSSPRAAVRSASSRSSSARAAWRSGLLDRAAVLADSRRRDRLDHDQPVHVAAGRSGRARAAARPRALAAHRSAARGGSAPPPERSAITS